MEVLLAPIFLGFIAVFCFCGWWIVTSIERRRVRIVERWAAYAARHRYAFRKGPSDEHPFTLEAVREGLPVVLEARRSRRTGDVVTRLAATVRRPAGGPVTCACGRARREGLDAPRAPTGDARFDRLFEVRARSEEDAAGLLVTPLRQALERFAGARPGDGLRFAADADHVAVEWPGDEVDPHRVEAAWAIVREVGAPRGPLG